MGILFEAQRIINLLLMVLEYSRVNSFLLIFFSFKCTLPTLNKIWFDLIWFEIEETNSDHLPRGQFVFIDPFPMPKYVLASLCSHCTPFVHVFLSKMTQKTQCTSQFPSTTHNYWPLPIVTFLLMCLSKCVCTFSKNVR